MACIFRLQLASNPELSNFLPSLLGYVFMLTRFFFCAPTGSGWFSSYLRGYGMVSLHVLICVAYPPELPRLFYWILLNLKGYGTPS